MARLLITGGAGYVGSHCAKALSAAGHECVVYDNLSRGHRECVKWGPLIEGDLRDAERLAQVFGSHSFHGVLHFAALAYVGESVQDPGKYYANNVVGTLNLLEAMRAAEVHRLVFSSTCDTCGDPVSLPMTEDHPQRSSRRRGGGFYDRRRVAGSPAPSEMLQVLIYSRHGDQATSVLRELAGGAQRICR